MTSTHQLSSNVLSRNAHDTGVLPPACRVSEDFRVLSASWACPAQVEQHMVNGEERTLLVHRKGSTRAFPPHHPLIPVDYQLTGQPVLIGGTMGTHSYVLTGALGLPLLRPVWPAPQRTPCARLSELMTHLGRDSRCSLLPGHMSSRGSPCLTSSAVCRHRQGHGRDVRQHVPWSWPRLQPQQRPEEPRLPDGALPWGNRRLAHACSALPVTRFAPSGRLHHGCGVGAGRWDGSVC